MRARIDMVQAVPYIQGLAFSVSRLACSRQSKPTGNKASSYSVAWSSAGANSEIARFMHRGYLKFYIQKEYVHSLDVASPGSFVSNS